MLKVFTLSSPDDSYDENFLSNYLNINIKPRIQRIQGVGEFFALGGDYAMRIWMKPDVMAQYKLVPSMSLRFWRNKTSNRQPVRSAKTPKIRSNIP